MSRRPAPSPVPEAPAPSYLDASDADIAAASPKQLLDWLAAAAKVNGGRAHDRLLAKLTPEQHRDVHALRIVEVEAELVVAERASAEAVAAGRIDPDLQEKVARLLSDLRVFRSTAELLEQRVRDAERARADAAAAAEREHRAKRHAERLVKFEAFDDALRALAVAWGEVESEMRDASTRAIGRLGFSARSALCKHSPSLAVALQVARPQLQHRIDFAAVLGPIDAPPAEPQ